MTKENLLLKIIELEWDMFAQVKNVGGRATCQQDKEMFAVMRTAQAASFSLQMLKSYEEDLLRAKSMDENLMTLKYARMMRYTVPAEYERIKDKLPEQNRQAEEILEKIMRVVMEFEESLVEQYPFLLKVGRPLRSKDDSEHGVSVETYFICELSTYSLKTLEIYYADLLEYKENGRNPSKKIMEYTVKSHGYANLEEANRILNTDV